MDMFLVLIRSKIGPIGTENNAKYQIQSIQTCKQRNQKHDILIVSYIIPLEIIFDITIH